MTKLLVIGGGPGGYVAAIRAAQLGAQVTLVEKQNMGGTCLNAGCIPTKALLHSAELYVQAQESAACGVRADVSLDFAKVQEYKNSIIRKLVGGVEALMKANGITCVRGTASFTGPKTIEVTGAGSMSAEKIIIASGSVPAIPPIPGLDGNRCMDSTGALTMENPPASLAIIGGGVIGVEMATAYGSMGSQVTIIEMLDEILPMMDRELTRIVRKEIEKRGVKILTGAKVLSAEDTKAGLAVHIEYQGKNESVKAEKALVSVGRRCNTSALNLEAAGIRHERGRIIVDEGQRTNVDGVFAVGDCTGGSMLAHVASAQAEAAAENALGRRAVYNGKTNPSCVYTNPEFAGVGLTEEQAKAKNTQYVTGRFPLAANGKSLISGGSGGMIKILAGKKYGEILGVHILGPRATDLIAEGALAIGLEATLDEIVSTIHAHPTVGEAVREAALAAEGRAVHIPNA
jgi:dihydrolipoamide dehydrogenase